MPRIELCRLHPRRRPDRAVRYTPVHSSILLCFPPPLGPLRSNTDYALHANSGLDGIRGCCLSDWRCPDPSTIQHERLAPGNVHTKRHHRRPGALQLCCQRKGSRDRAGRCGLGSDGIRRQVEGDAFAVIDNGFGGRKEKDNQREQGASQRFYLSHSEETLDIVSHSFFFTSQYRIRRLSFTMYNQVMHQ